MKKSLVKLVAVSATAMSLATVVVPAANAQPQDGGYTDQATPNAVDLEAIIANAAKGIFADRDLTQMDANTLAQRLIKEINDLYEPMQQMQGQISQLEDQVQKDKKACDIASSKVVATKAEYDSAKTKLDDYYTLYKEAQDANIDYKGEYDARKLEIENALNAAISRAEIAYTDQMNAEAAAVENARGALESAKAAEAEAAAYYEIAPEGEKEAAKADWDAKVAERQAAEKTLKEAEFVQANSNAESVKDNAILAAKNEHSAAISNLNKEFVFDDGYKKVEKLNAEAHAKKEYDTFKADVYEPAKEAYNSAKSEEKTACDALKKSQAKLTSTKEDYSSNVSKLQNFQKVLSRVLEISNDNASDDKNKVDDEIKQEIEDALNKKPGASFDDGEADVEDEVPAETEIPDGETTVETEGSTEKGTDKEDSKDGKKVEKKEDKKSDAKLPETGEASTYAIFGAAALSILAGLGLVAPKFSKED
ncbi:LPXTG cell wall anchor domain-containing protein [Ignavigranum ruoffiae]|uniref:LPXTG cell wall anchor domain-containing protein n=1 Tax=Ignavigranum ruoffiae TaxID=89093 RepID=UPI0024ACA06D|nr:LPXTG cell wall anchor domain-containing protein [Ignavigranum ruoffiae]